MKKFFVFITMCYAFSSQAQMFSDFTREEVEQDIQFLFSALEEIHPEGAKFSEIYAADYFNQFSNDIYSESDAFFIINKLLKQLNDGHSNVKFSKERIKIILQHGAFFPYDLEFFDSTAVIVGHVNSELEFSERKEILRINNVPINKILEDLRIVAMVDGEDNSSASDWLSQDFWFYYTLYNGFRNSYSVTYIENGQLYHNIEKATQREGLLKTQSQEKRANPVQLKFHDEIPVVSISNFAQKSRLWWTQKIKSILGELEKDQVEHLILDLRNNGGGKESLQNTILEAFGIDKTDKYAFEGLKDAKFSEVSGVKNKTKEYLKSLGLELFQFNQTDSEVYRVKKSSRNGSAKPPLFTGNVFVLIDGTTFSCASDAAALIRENYPKTTLVGTETRGSGKENYAGYFIHVILPNTQLEVRIPRVKYVLNTSFTASRGVVPDLLVNQQISDTQLDIDTQLMFVLDLLRQDQLGIED